MKDNKNHERLSSDMIISKNKLHWIIFLKPVFTLIVATIILTNLGSIPMLYFLWLIIFPFTLILALIFYLSFSLIVTDDRIIFKKYNIDLSNVRRIRVKQSILGKILDYGTVNIIDPNGIEKKFKNIRSPLSFQKIVEEHIESLLIS